MEKLITLCVSIVVITITAIVSSTYYSIQQNEAMKSSIESAIVKGIDPMAVRCAYGSNDNICMVYAATMGKNRATPIPVDQQVKK